VILETDLPVLGGGGTGARAALAAAEEGLAVTLASKNPPGRAGSTALAFETMQAALGPGDSPELHCHDTFTCGRRLSYPHLARALAGDAPGRVKDLADLGVDFKRDLYGRVTLIHEPGQTVSRSCFINGGGSQLMKVLVRALSRAGVEVLPDVACLEVVLWDGSVAGAVLLDLASGNVLPVKAGAVILATGGYGQLWSMTDTAVDTTGDGVALAYRAGATLTDLEMVLFYPTAVVHPHSCKGMLIPYEVFLDPAGLAGRLLNSDGTPLDTSPLPTRDTLVSMMMAQFHQEKATPNGGLWLDLASSPLTHGRKQELMAQYLPRAYIRHLGALGVDILESPVEVSPMVHYSLGGVLIDENGLTTVPGLFAAGEVAGNVHGANRLSGNALTETQVFGYRAGKAASSYLKSPRAATGEDMVVRAARGWRERTLGLLAPKSGQLHPHEIKAALKAEAWKRLGLERNDRGIRAFLDFLEDASGSLGLMGVLEGLDTPYPYPLLEALEVSMMLETSRLVALSAIAREETRGHHFRSDYPDALEEPSHTQVSPQGEGSVIRRAVL
jgi:succinate dehydrogenase/fumarate reductase flavoprotein subunit